MTPTSYTVLEDGEELPELRTSLFDSANVVEQERLRHSCELRSMFCILAPDGWVSLASQRGSHLQLSIQQRIGKVTVSGGEGDSLGDVPVSCEVRCWWLQSFV
jgi:predicted RNA binding protein YcfA (HicA-like mRNA interferase family)